jgi:hypothetical protein
VLRKPDAQYQAKKLPNRLRREQQKKLFTSEHEYCAETEAKRWLSVV